MFKSSSRSSRPRSKISRDGLKRALSPIQIQLLSMGGVIGVGLFYGSGVALTLAGPAVVLDYVIGGIVVAIVMRALGEMTVEEPTAGSFSRFAENTMGPMMGFITGGMWWFFWVSTVMSELAAIGLLVQFWVPALPAWIPGLIALILFTFANFLHVKVFGSVEFWFAVLKIFAIAAFIGLGVFLAIRALFGGHHVAGIPNLWRFGGFFPHGFAGPLQAFSLVVLGYSGVETLAVTAGETAQPEKSVPRAISNVIWRIAILYIGSIFVMLIAFPWSALVGHHTSPYVLLFTRIGLPLAATVINAIIITSGLSSSNTGLYGGSRMLFSLSQEERLPKYLRHLSSNKVPVYAVLATGIAMSLGIVLTYLAPNTVYVWISSAASFAAIWTWSTILVSELLFKKRSRSHALKFPIPGGPWLPMIGLLLLVGILLAIMISPLTAISVWAGIAWLLFLLVYWHLRAKSTPKP